MPTLPPGYTAGAPAAADVDAVIDLLHEVDRAEGADPIVTKEWQLHEWRRPRFELERDARLVLTPDGSMAGYAEVYDSVPRAEVESSGRVHPGHTGLGIGSWIVGWVEASAEGLADGARVDLYVDVSADDAAAASLFRARGFEPVRYFWHMEVDIERPPTPREIEGISVRTLKPGRDDRALHALMSEAFSGHWGYPDESLTEWRQSLMGRDDYDPDLWWVALDGAKIVGTLIGNIASDDVRSWVSELAVDRAYRGRGIGSCLLEHAFAEFHRRGMPKVRLNVDSENETGATRLYEKVGMSIVRRFVIYLKTLG